MPPRYSRPKHRLFVSAAWQVGDDCQQAFNLARRAGQAAVDEVSVTFAGFGLAGSRSDAQKKTLTPIRSASSDFRSRPRGANQQRTDEWSGEDGPWPCHAGGAISPDFDLRETGLPMPRLSPARAVLP